MATILLRSWLILSPLFFSYANACIQNQGKIALISTTPDPETITEIEALKVELERPTELLIPQQQLESLYEPNLRCGKSISFNPHFDPSELNPPQRSSPESSHHRHGNLHNVFNRVVGGDEVTLTNAWPWMVAIYRRGPNNMPRFRCSGVLINQAFVLTSAACLGNLTPSQIYLSLGSNKLSMNTSNLVSVEAIRIHESFSQEYRGNDIGLIKLKFYVPYSSNVNSICLPGTNESKVVLNKNVVVVGWYRSFFFSRKFYYQIREILWKMKYFL